MGTKLFVTLKVNTPFNLHVGNVEFTGFAQSIQHELPLVYLEIKTLAGNIEKLSGRADKASVNFNKIFFNAPGQYEATAFAVVDQFLALTTK